MNYAFYMEKALELAKNAYQINETPIGCVIVFQNEIIGYGYNSRNRDKNALAHAELTAIHMACGYINDWRLEECTMFVTLEPCPMCAGAIVQSRIPTLVYGAKNPKAGSVDSILNILNNPKYNHQVQVVSGILENECSQLMKDFFRRLRMK